MYKIFSTIVIVVIIVVQVPLTALGHGLAITQQQLVGDYIVEFEYDGTGQVIAGELTAYAFELLDKAHNEQISYERMFAKISKQGASRPVFAGNLVPVELLGRKTARVNLMLGDSGPYTVELSFYKGSEELAKTTFSFDVAVNMATLPQKEENARQYVYLVVFAVLLIVIGVQFYWLNKKRKNKLV